MSGQSVRITEIKITKQGLCALFCCSGFLFSVDEETLARYAVAVGSELSLEQLEALQHRSAEAKAWAACLRYIAARTHSQAELRQKLSKRYGKEAASLAVEKAAAAGYADDAKYAEIKAREDTAFRRRSRRDTVSRLLAKGVSRQEAEAAVEQLPQESDAENIARLLQGSYRRALAEGKTEKVAAALRRRGFSGRDIRQALDASGQEAQDILLEPEWED